MTTISRNALGTMVCALACTAGAACGQNTPPAPARAVADMPAAVPDLAPVTVDLKDASVLQVAAALKDASGVDFHRIVEYGQPSPDASFTLAAKDKSLWEVYTLLARQGPLDLQPDAGGIGLLARSGGAIMNASRPAEGIRGDTSMGSVAVAYEQAAGPLLIRAGTKYIPAATGIGTGNQAASRPAQMADDAAHPVLRVAAVVDPRLTVTPGELKMGEAIDENGKKLAIDKVQKVSPDMRAAGGANTGAPPRENRRINNWAWQVTLDVPKGHGKSIASAKGQVVMEVATENDVMVVNEPVKKRNQPLLVGGRTFTITAFDLLEGVINVRVVSSPVAPSSLPTDKSATILPFTVTVLDAVDKEGWSATGLDTVIGHFNMFQMRYPLKLKLTVTTKTKEVVVPFELKDLPIP